MQFSEVGPMTEVNIGYPGSTEKEKLHQTEALSSILMDKEALSRWERAKDTSGRWLFMQGYESLK